MTASDRATVPKSRQSFDDDVFEAFLRHYLPLLSYFCHEPGPIVGLSAAAAVAELIVCLPLSGRVASR
ncbi:MAG: hypothetical protein R3C20_04790 [Planctomycetaceae bacterium]